MTRRGRVGAATAAAIVASLVLLAAQSASAATHTYWDGVTIRNEVKNSGTHTMRISQAFTSLPVVNARVTIASHGSVEGAADAEMILPSAISTSTYCQWRVAPGGVYTQSGLTCRYSS